MLDIPATIDLKSDLLWRIRSLLHAEQFKEVVTPTFRRADDLTGSRPEATVGSPGFLRSMIGPALRYNLQYTQRVFEIGPCFRAEIPDATHAREFSMLDLYTTDAGFDYLLGLAQRLVALAYPHPLAQISVADHIKTTLGVDLVHEPVEPNAIAKHLGVPARTPLPDLLDAYIRAEVEPLTLGCGAFLTDLPLGGNEPCAKRRAGTVAILNRFEVFIDGIEVVHGYEDETNTAEFLDRAHTINLYNAEQHLVQQAVHAGQVPPGSVGLGIGIERLCMAATGIHDIRKFQHSTCF